MPSQPPVSASWGFGPVLDFLHEDDTSTVASPPLRPGTQASTFIDNTHKSRDHAAKPAIHLGTFNKLWERLGISIEPPLPALSPLDPETEISSSDDALLSSPADATDFERELESRPQVKASESRLPVESPQRRPIAKDSSTNIKSPKTSLPEPTSDKTSRESYDGRRNDVKAAREDKTVPTTSVPAPDTIAKEDPQNASDDTLYAGLSKKQRKKARQRVEKARQLEGQIQESIKKNDDEGLWDRLTAYRELQEGHSANPPASSTPIPATSRSRSNVGAKINHPTPVLPAKSDPIRSLPTPARNTSNVPQPSPVSNAPTQIAAVPQHALQHINVSDIFGEEALPATPTPTYHARQNLTSSVNIPAYHASTSSLPPHLQQQQLGRVPAGSHNTSFSNDVTPVQYHDLNRQQPYNTVGTSYNAARPMTHASTPLGHLPVYTPVPSAMTRLDFVPSSVQPAIQTGKKSAKKAMVSLSKEDRHWEFLTKLIRTFPTDKKWLVAPMRLSSDKMSSEGIHVFVDASNILIGFQDMIRRNSLPRSGMSFDCLALLLERRRPVAKRVYAGSTRVSAPHLSNEKFSELAEAVGYEPNIYEQVYKTKELTSSQKFFKDVERVGWTKAQELAAEGASGSDSETGADPATPKPAPKWVEQGVDESLHLKMCQSIIDCETPSTMVLATGDGAGAEYSDGFLAHVERALKRGWYVELVSWKQQTSSGYRKKAFRAKWGERFNIIELDDFLVDMMDA